MEAGVVQVNDARLKCELMRLRDILGESYGALGRLSLLHPFTGAALSCSNRSGRIVQLLKTDNPITKIILTALQLHCQHFRDAGIYAALLINNLILRGLELPYPQHKVAMVTGYVMSLVCDWMERDDCPAKRRLNLTSTEELVCLVKTFLGSKLAVYGVTSVQLDHLSSLLLQGFLWVAPNNSTEIFSFSEHLHILSCSGHPTHQSLLLGGVVIPVSKEETVVDAVKRGSDGLIPVALFNSSLAGDLEDYPGGVSLEVESNSGLCHITLDDVVVAKLMGVASDLVQLGVGFVGCQKCVHPQLKDYLKEKGVHVVERLSSLHFEPVKTVSGAELVENSSTESAFSKYWVGSLKELRLVTVLGETYLQMEGVSDDHCSLILTSHLKMVSEEMTVLFKDAVAILEQTLSSPFILSGGGCMEMLAAHHLMQKAKDKATIDCLTELQCDQRTLNAVAKSVADSFVAMATSLEHNRGLVAVDSTFHHCWSLPPLSEATPTLRKGQTCRCGAVTSSMLPIGCRLAKVTSDGEGLVLSVVEEKMNQREEASTPAPGYPRVCDSYSAKLRATELAGDIASTILQTAWVAIATTSTDTVH